jgi:monoamine oxidase
MRELSRRQVINLIGKAGGAAAAYDTMVALDLLPAPAAHAGAPELPPHSGAGTSVLILGAGIAGMVSAYELRKSGYDCLILEARSRPGGRNWSLRSGDVVEETDSKQLVTWDHGAHMYLNPGPARIPQHHTGILSYCRELDIPIEIFANDNRGAFLHDDGAFGGAPQTARAVIGDARGFVAELAAKAVKRDLFDNPLSNGDKERLFDFLQRFGDLDSGFLYKGSERSGYSTLPGAGAQAGIVNQPIDFAQLLASDFWRGPRSKMHFGEHYLQAATMLQPVGGMGRIGEAFADALGPIVRYGAEVIRIRKTPSGVTVFWRDHQAGGAIGVAEASCVICTIPLTVLRHIDADFSSPVRTAIASVPYVPAGKAAFQAERRFWELDHQIYGGISWTSPDITQIWYPSAGLHQKKGVLVGAYIFDHGPGTAFNAKAPDQRLRDAIADGEHVHPGCAATLVKGVSVGWSKVPFSLGGWADWSSDPLRQHYRTLLEGDPPVFFSGEHMSRLTGWQEGAVLSAHFTINQVAAYVRDKKN